MGATNLDDDIPGTPADAWELKTSQQEHRIHRRSWEVVPVGRSPSSFEFEDDLSIFPPSEHENLLLDYTLTTSSSSSSSSSSSNSSDCHTECLNVGRPQTSSSVPSLDMFCDGHLRRLRGTNEWRRMWRFGWWIVTSGVEVVHSKIFSWGRRDGVVGFSAVDERRGFLWAVSMAVMAVWMAFLRRWHRREKLRLLLLIHEKDQMIGRLLQVLAQRN